jgi:hypothetical protein
VNGTIWMSENFFEAPRRRSWSGPMTRLERIAENAGIDGDEYRFLLADAIQARRREVGAAWERLDTMLDKRADGG